MNVRPANDDNRFAALDAAIVEVVRAHPTLPAVIKLAQAYRELWEASDSSASRQAPGESA